MPSKKVLRSQCGRCLMNRHWRHLLALAWLAVIIALGIYTVKALLVESKIQFDLLALLPQGKTEEIRLANEFMDDGNVSGRLVIAFGHMDAAKAKHALEHFRQEVHAANLPIQEHDLKHIEADYKTLFTSLYSYRAGLISKEDHQHLINDSKDALIKSAVGNILSPFGSFNASQISTDPFGFYPRFVTAFGSGHVVQTDSEGNMLAASNGKTWAIYQGEVTEKIFSLKLQEKISKILQPILAHVEGDSGVEVRRVGTAFYASAGAQQAQSEISLIGLASTLGIIFILLWIFRSPNPILFAVSVVSSGLIGGLGASLLAFNSIHILAVVFGSSLVGVAVDYALHYYCASFKPIDRFSIFSTLLPAMPLGVLTSFIGYGALMIAPFPGIQQMALLACVGLICTFISVAAWGPYFIKSGDRKVPPLANQIQHTLEKLAAAGSIKYLKLFVGIALCVLCCAGFALGKNDDNIKNFQSMDAKLKQQEEGIKSLLNFNNATKFIAITGPNLENILQTEEKISQALDKHGTHYRALSDLIPSQKRQQEIRNLKLKFCEANFPEIAKTLGIDRPFNAAEAGFDEQALIADTHFIKSLPTGWKELIHVGDEGSLTGRIMLNDKGFNFNCGGTYVDPVLHYSSLFKSYREVMIWLIIGLLPGFALLISIRQGLQAAIAIITPVLLSIMTTVGILGLCGIGLSMFHAMGLILVLCIGIDYALFLFWRKPQEKELLLLGNVLAAMTTILSFGLLTLSNTHAVHSFGLVVFLGIVLNFFITTLFLGNIKCKKS